MNLEFYLVAKPPFKFSSPLVKAVIDTSSPKNWVVAFSARNEISEAPLHMFPEKVADSLKLDYTEIPLKYCFVADYFFQSVPDFANPILLTKPKRLRGDFDRIIETIEGLLLKYRRQALEAIRILDDHHLLKNRRYSVGAESFYIQDPSRLLEAGQVLEVAQSEDVKIARILNEIPERAFTGADPCSGDNFAFF